MTEDRYVPDTESVILGAQDAGLRMNTIEEGTIVFSIGRSCHLAVLHKDTWYFRATMMDKVPASSSCTTYEPKLGLRDWLDLVRQAPHVEVNTRQINAIAEHGIGALILI